MDDLSDDRSARMGVPVPHGPHAVARTGSVPPSDVPRGSSGRRTEPLPSGTEEPDEWGHRERGYGSRQAEAPGPGVSETGFGFRAWFALYLGWMIALAVTLLAGQGAAEHGSRLGLAFMILAGYAFYLSLCCTFFPAPTMWVVMLVASNDLGLVASPFARVALVAGLGAFATAMANLNEYHIFTFLLRYDRQGRLRGNRAYRWAARWFTISPFTIIWAFAFIPLPVDVIRWLAILYQYSRTRFFAAYMLGRSLRYAVWAVSAVALNLAFWQIVAFQVALLAIAALKLVVSSVYRRGRPAPSAGSDSGPPCAGCALPSPKARSVSALIPPQNPT